MEKSAGETTLMSRPVFSTTNSDFLSKGADAIREMRARFRRHKENKRDGAAARAFLTDSRTCHPSNSGAALTF